MACKSAAALSVTPPPGFSRPKPPRGADYLERHVWDAVVDSLPDKWVDPAAQEVLRQAVTQAATARRLEQRLRKMRAQNLYDDLEYTKAVIAHEKASKTSAYLLSHLRATPRSRMTSRESRTAIDKTPPTKPWLIKAVATAHDETPKARKDR